MSTIEDKFEQYLNSMNSAIDAAFLRAAVAAIPEDAKRQFIINNCPVKIIKHDAAPLSPKERDDRVHVRHCSIDGCKYGEDTCPVVSGEVEREGLPEVKHEEPQPRIWRVPVCRTGYGHRIMEVIATTEREAIDKAIDEAGSESFSENDADYSAPDGAM